MKRLTAIALALVLAFTLSMTAFAAEINQDSNIRQVDTEITTSIAPTYTVTIPADVQVTFNETSTTFGTVKLDAAQIDPGYAIKVELEASGLLKNQADTTKTIAYTVNDANGDIFTVGTYTTAGDKTDLTIDITQAAWNAAFAGSYSDTLTFTVSYINTVTP